MDNKNKNVIDIRKIASALWQKRKLFVKVWVITFVLSCIWILPQPRYYDCEVSLAPESSNGGMGGGLSSIASSFGINLGNASGGSDAIYPQLYPDLFESKEFLVELFDIRIQTSEDNDNIETDYYTYLDKYQKENPYALPFMWIKKTIRGFFANPEPEHKGKNGKRFDPFFLSKRQSAVVKNVQDNIKCEFSKTTEIITITVRDQDPLVAALLADSIKARLQSFIVDYRTKKARNDYEYYSRITEQTKAAYDSARIAYANYVDTHQYLDMEIYKSKMSSLSEDIQQKNNLYVAMNTQLESAKAKIQENTPAFTTLKSASVPDKPAGPKRMIFVAAMLILASIATAGWQYKKELVEWF